jgi:hypothetical protein
MARARMTPTLTLPEGRKEYLNKFFIGLLNNEWLEAYPHPSQREGRRRG